MTKTTHIYDMPSRSLCGQTDREMVKAEWIQYEGIVFQGGMPIKPCRRCNSILESYQLERERQLNGLR